jgi:molybdopterin-biosynthesis enzyme MoeA-like protein
MEAIFETSILGLLQTLAPGTTYLERVFVTGVGDESKLAPILQEVMRQVPRVYLKSRATHFGPDVKLEVILSASGQQGEVEAILERAEDELRRRLSDF